MHPDLPCHARPREVLALVRIRCEKVVAFSHSASELGEDFLVQSEYVLVASWLSSKPNCGAKTLP